MVTPAAICVLASELIDRAATGEPAVRAERELFEPLAEAYFRDRSRALAGAAPPLTTLLLEASRAIWDHLVADAIRHGGPVPRSASSRLRYDAGVRTVLADVLSGHLPGERTDRVVDAITAA
ncbi:hypothetical protein L083_3528 [Actinoplanes sp. N902-109]|nr:hypothetical protein L083_3528 [Actinoplanes sp. N902-109]